MFILMQTLNYVTKYNYIIGYSSYPLVELLGTMGNSGHGCRMWSEVVLAEERPIAGALRLCQRLD